MNMKMYTGTFTKKSGEERTMRFVRLSDLPEQFLNEQVSGTGTARNLSDGLELVWDVENNGFRVFNWNTVTTETNFENVEENTIFSLNNTSEVV